MKLLRDFAVALGGAYLFLLPRFKHIFVAWNRYRDPWHVEYAFAILCAIAIWGFCFWICLTLVHWIGQKCPKRMWKSLNILETAALGYLFFRTVIGLLYPLCPPFLQACVDCRWVRCVYYLLPPCCAYFLPLGALRVFHHLYVAIALLLGTNILTCSFWPRFPRPAVTTLPIPWRTEVPAQNRHLFVLIMDEWSFRETFQNKNAFNKLPNLQSWLATSTFYTDAYAPGNSTRLSLPRILFPTDTELSQYNAKELDAFHLQAMPPKGKSIFSIPSHEDALRIAYGGYLQYPVLLANENMDFCARIDTPSTRRTFATELERLLIEPAQQLWSRLGIHAPPHSPILQMEWPQLEIHETTEQLMASLSPRQNSMIWMHYLVPHFPERLPDGKIFPAPEISMSEQPFDWHGYRLQAYESSLRFMDTLLGALKTSWQERDEWASACIILMSDHEWRSHPDHSLYSQWGANNELGFVVEQKTDDLIESFSWKHVPLVIKYPGQSEPEIVTNRVYVKDIHRLVSAYWASSNPNPNTLRAWPCDFTWMDSRLASDGASGLSD